MLLEITNLYKNKVASLSNEEAAYALGFAFLVTLLLPSVLPFPSYWLSFSFFICGAFIWLNSILAKLSSMIFAKAFWAIILVAGSTFNLAFSSSIVNSSLEVPNSPFGYTITLSSVLLIPVTLSLSGIFVMMPVIALVALTSAFSIKNTSIKQLLLLDFIKTLKPQSGLLFFGRVFACVTIMALCLSFAKDNSWYTDKVGVAVKWFAYNFEMERYSYCKLNEGQHITYLSGDYVIVAEEVESTYKFTVTKCDSEL